MSSPVDIRELALGALLEVRREGTPVHLVLRSYLEKYQYLSKPDRSFFSRLVKGVLEQQIRIDYCLDQFAKLKVRKMKPVFREILRLSALQILFLDRIPDSAAVNEGVKLVTRKGMGGLRGVANGILRSLSREKEKISYPEKEPERSSVLYSMPVNLIEEWQDTYGAEITEIILKGFLEERPLHVRLRVNAEAGLPDKTKGEKQSLTWIFKEEILASLQEEGVEVEPSPWLSDGAYLKNIDYVTALDAFRKGWIQIQDASSMLAVRCAGIKPGDRVMDLCAAPGGKSVYAADLTGSAGAVISGDVADYKTEWILSNVERLNLKNVEVKVWDAADLDPAYSESADVVLADVPCSGLGVIGKKPDIKYRIAEEQNSDLVNIQRQILRSAANCVKKGGTLLFSTCTIRRQENQDQAEWIEKELGLIPESLDSYLPESLRNAETVRGQLQLLPGLHPCDGFFIARFRKA